MIDPNLGALLSLFGGSGDGMSIRPFLAISLSRTLINIRQQRVSDYIG